MVNGDMTDVIPVFFCVCVCVCMLVHLLVGLLSILLQFGKMDPTDGSRRWSLEFYWIKVLQ